jgi:hypothetical protein
VTAASLTNMAEEPISALEWKAGQVALEFRFFA